MCDGIRLVRVTQERHHLQGRLMFAGQGDPTCCSSELKSLRSTFRVARITAFNDDL